MASKKSCVQNPKVEKLHKVQRKKSLKVKNVPKCESKEIVVNTQDEVKNSMKTNKFIMPSKAIDDNLIDLCLDALLKLSDHNKKKKSIFDDETPIFAEIHCIKIQNTSGIAKFILPHTTFSSTEEVCLITPDLKKGKRPDHEPTIDHWEEKFRKAGVTKIKTFLPMRQLRVEYDQFELKRRLLTQHDFIMVDKRVLSHVKHLLGKIFSKKHNMLIPVKINEKDLKKSIDVGLHTAFLKLCEGQTSTLLIGHTGMSNEHLKDNIISFVQQIKEKYPGGEANIRSISLKLPLSLSLPLYLTLRPAVITPPRLTRKRPYQFTVLEDELSTIPGSKVRVAPDGTVHLIKPDAHSDQEMNDDDEDDEDNNLSS